MTWPMLIDRGRPAFIVWYHSASHLEEDMLRTRNAKRQLRKDPFTCSIQLAEWACPFATVELQQHMHLANVRQLMAPQFKIGGLPHSALQSTASSQARGPRMPPAGRLIEVLLSSWLVQGLAGSAKSVQFHRAIYNHQQVRTEDATPAMWVGEWVCACVRACMREGGLGGDSEIKAKILSSSMLICSLRPVLVE